MWQSERRAGRLVCIGLVAAAVTIVGDVVAQELYWEPTCGPSAGGGDYRMATTSDGTVYVLDAWLARYDAFSDSWADAGFQSKARVTS